jgi:hypothetical protein
MRRLGAAVLAVLALAIAAPAETDDGLAPMPENAARVLAEALDAAVRGAKGYRAEALAGQRAALEALKLVPLPDPTRMERVVVRQGKDWFVLGWKSKGAADGALVTDDAFVDEVVHRPESRVEASSLKEEIDEAVALVRADVAGEPVTGKPRFLRTASLTDGSVDALVRCSVWAAWLGRDADARVLADAAVRVSSSPFSKVVDAEARRWFARGALRLEAGAPWGEVAAVWRTMLPWSRTTKYGRTLPELVEQLTVQAAAPAPAKVADAAALPVAERAAYFVTRLPDSRGQAPDSPHDVYVHGPRHFRSWSESAIALGRDAVPALLAALEDRRVTRIVVRAELGLFTDIVVRVQDVAVYCLEMIANVRMPATYPGGTEMLSQLAPDQRSAAVERIRAWWRKHGTQSDLQMRMSTLMVFDIAGLLEIELLDPKALDVVGTLHSWAVHAPDRTLAEIAGMLAERRDLSLKPRVRALVEDRRKQAQYEAIWYLLRWGDVSDIALLAQRQREDRRRGTRLGEGGTYYPAVGAAATQVWRADGRDWLHVPLLLDVLGEREVSGSRSLHGGSASVAFSVADDAIEALADVTGHDAKHYMEDTPMMRFGAIDRWRAWWDAEGAAAFVKEHPELSGLVIPAPPGQEAIERALAAPFVPADSPTMPRARYEIPPAPLRALLAARDVVARTAPTGEVEFAFASDLSEAKWFVAAGPAQDGAVPSLVVGASEAWVDTRGRLWCVARHGDAGLSVFTGLWTNVPRTDDDASWEDHGIRTAWPGADGAMVLVTEEGAAHLVDDGGHVAAPAPVAPDYGLLLALDTAGRVWWWTARDGIGVVADGKAFRGARPEIPRGSGELPSLEGLAPLPDGTVVAWNDRGDGVVLRLGDARIEPGIGIPVHADVPGVPRCAVDAAGRRLVGGLPLDVKDVVLAGKLTSALRLVASAGGVDWSVSGGGSDGGAVHATRGERTATWRIPRDRRFLGLVPAADGTAWVLLRGVLVHLSPAGDDLEKDRRIELADDEQEGTLHSGGDGRMWLLSGGEFDRTARCLFVGR